MNQKQGKITVKHYLNARARPRIYKSKRFYPLYIQIIVSGQKAQLKSKIPDYLPVYRGYIEKWSGDRDLTSLIGNGYFTDDLLKGLKVKEVFPFPTLFNDEIRLITSIIRSGEPFHNDHFTLVNFSHYFDNHLKDIFDVLEAAVKKIYLEELNRLFLETSNHEEDRTLFRLSNYFIHFINWKNNFCEIYEMTFEMLPSEIKYIENHLSDDLRVRIKALMAFHGRENYLRRFLDKTEKGLFPTVHYIDWLEQGRDFISREFIKIFGKQKADEYITTIDSILSRKNEPALIL